MSLPIQPIQSFLSPRLRHGYYHRDQRICLSKLRGMMTALSRLADEAARASSADAQALWERVRRKVIDVYQIADRMEDRLLTMYGYVDLEMLDALTAHKENLSILRSRAHQARFASDGDTFLRHVTS